MLSRFWYFVLGSIAAGALATAYLVQASTQRSSDASTEQALRRDRFEVELWMSLDGRARIEAIGPMAEHGDVRNGLTEANARPAGSSFPAGARQRMTTTLTELNRQLAEGAADVLVVVDRGGVIVAQVGGGAPALDQSLRELDVVRAALTGTDEESIWMRNGEPLRAVSRPVFVAGHVVGAIVHAMEIDDDLARRLMTHVEGSSVGFFLGERFIASAEAEGSAGAASREVLQSGLSRARATPELRQSGRTQPLTIGTNTRAIYALFPGQPVEGSLGFVVARRRDPASSPFAVLRRAPSDDVAHLPWLLIVGLPFVVALIGVLLTWLERDRPLTAFATQVKALASGSSTKLASEGLKDRFRILAEDVNAGLERAATAAKAAERKSTSLDELLGNAPAASKPAFYAPPAAAEKPAPAPVAPVAAPAAPAPAAVPPAPQAPQAPVATPTPEPPKSQGISMPPDDFDDDEGATTVAQIPAELLSTLLQDAEDEAQHFRATFAEYVRVREQCGESTAGLSYEKFESTLRKTKDQIIQRHGGTRVHFTVYVKEGKAALKAAPR